MFFFSQINDESLPYKLDATVRNMAKRFGFEGKIHLKHASKVYREVSRKDLEAHKYIPNFDEMTVDEKRDVLGKFFGFHKVGSLPPEKVERYFSMKIGQVSKELEQDLLEFS